MAKRAPRPRRKGRLYRSRRAPKKAAGKLQKAADEAVLSLQKTSAEASATIRSAIGEANEKILEVTKSAIKEMVGEKEAEFFDLGPLKERWTKKE